MQACFRAPVCARKKNIKTRSNSLDVTRAEVICFAPKHIQRFFKQLDVFYLFYLITCIVKTPSSWEDSFFICSAKTCASSRMENSVSAPQYPLERAKQINTKLREKAMKPPREPMCLSRKAARAFGLKNRGFSADRLAMMVEGVYKLEKHGVRTGGFEGGELQGKLLLQLCSVEYVCPFSPVQVSRIPSDTNHCASLKSLQRRKQIHAGQGICLFFLFFPLTLSVFPLRSVAPTPGSLAKCVWAGESPQRGWK